MRKISAILMFLLVLAGTSSANAQATLSISDFHIGRGETKTISIDMTNEMEVRAFQVQLVLPKYLKLDGKPTVVPSRQGTFINDFGERVEAVKNLSCITKDDGSVMILVNANDALPFAGTEGAVVNIPLVADKDAVVGLDNIELLDMELVFADGTTYVRPKDYSCQVQIVNGTTSISQLEQMFRKPVDVYNVEGVLIQSNVEIKNLRGKLQPGVYIIEGYKVTVDR